MERFWGVVFHENIPLVSPSLDQKEQNFFDTNFIASSFVLVLIVEMTGRVTAISG